MRAVELHGRGCAGWTYGVVEGGEQLTAHDPDIFFVFGEVLDREVRRGFFERCQDMVWVCDAGVFQAREGIVVAMCPKTVSMTTSDVSKGRDSAGEHAPAQLMGMGMG